MRSSSRNVQQPAIIVLLLPLLLVLSAAVASVVPLAEGGATQRCVGSTCPVWPAAVHMEAEFTNVACTTVKGRLVCSHYAGNTTWDTLGDPGKPTYSLTHYRRNWSLTDIPGTPYTLSEFWQECPSHESWHVSSLWDGNDTPISNYSCAELPAPCIHRYDPISLALSACASWRVASEPGQMQHYSGSRCNFTVLCIATCTEVCTLPGVRCTGSFDVWFRDGDPVPHKFITNTSVVQSSGIGVVANNFSETMVTTYSDSSPDQAPMRGHCTPRA